MENICFFFERILGLLSLGEMYRAATTKGIFNTLCNIFFSNIYGVFFHHVSLIRPNIRDTTITFDITGNSVT